MPKTIEDIINDVLIAEGGSQVTNDPLDVGGRTQWGISEKSNPEAWVDGKVTEAEARAIYEAKYAKPFLGILDPKLLQQTIDFSVNSGPQLVIMKLQTIVGTEIDGILGPITIDAINNTAGVNNKLVAERIKMIGRIIQKDQTQARFLVGWLQRSLEFLS